MQNSCQKSFNCLLCQYSVLLGRIRSQDSMPTLSNNFWCVGRVTPQFQLCSAPPIVASYPIVHSRCQVSEDLRGVNTWPKYPVNSLDWVHSTQTMSNIAKCTPSRLSVTFVNSSLNNIFTTKKINNHLTSPQPSSSPAPVLCSVSDNV